MGLNAPFKLPLTVVGSGHLFFVQDADGKQVSNRHWHRSEAEAAMERLEREARVTRRACLKCRAPFLSEGPHNRMCKECRRLSPPVPV